jgi:hypothetical protein
MASLGWKGLTYLLVHWNVNFSNHLFCRLETRCIVQTAALYKPAEL